MSVHSYGSDFSAHSLWYITKLSTFNQLLMHPMASEIKESFIYWSLHICYIHILPSRPKPATSKENQKKRTGVQYAMSSLDRHCNVTQPVYECAVAEKRETNTYSVLKSCFWFDWFYSCILFYFFVMHKTICTEAARVESQFTSTVKIIHNTRKNTFRNIGG